MYIENINNTNYIKVNDTATRIQLKISDNLSNPFDLKSAMQVVVVIGNRNGRILSKIPNLLDDTGVLEFSLDEGDLLDVGGNLSEVGDNLIEVHIIMPNGEKFVAPSSGHYKLRVTRSIDTLGEEVTTVTLDYFLEEANRVLDEMNTKVEYVNQTAEDLRLEVATAIQHVDDSVKDLRQEVIDMQTRMIKTVGDVQKLNIETYDGSNQPIHPSVIYIQRGFRGYKYWMAMTPFPYGDWSLENPSIMCSHDGVNWVVPEGFSNPIAPAPETGFYADPVLVYDYHQRKLKLWWAWLDAETSPNNSNMYSELSLGANTWTTPEQIPYMGPGGVVISGTREKPIYESWEKNAPYKIAKRLSHDGKNWTRRYNIPHNLRGGINHLLVYKDAAGYHFLVSAYPEGEGTNHSALYYGYSNDGSYIEFDQVPVLNGASEIFPTRNVYTTSMAPMGTNEYGLWVSGYNDDIETGVGLLKIKLGNLPTNPKQRNVILFEDYEIRDTANKESPYLLERHIPHFDDYTNKTILFKNTHDVPLTLEFISWWADGGTVFTIDGEDQSVELPNSSRIQMITGDTLKLLRSQFPGNVILRVRAKDAAPTTGNLSMEIRLFN